MKNYTEEFIGKVMAYAEDEYGVGSNREHYNADEVYDYMTRLFLEIHEGREIITEEFLKGDIYLPVKIKSKDGRVYVAILDYDTFKSKVKPQNIFLLVPSMGLINIDIYLEYLGDWADEFTPYEVYESKIRII